MTFGEKFRSERKKRNLTQQQAADGLGLTRKMITLYESGHSYPRSKAAFQKIADYFEVELEYFMGRDEAFLVRAADQYGSRGKKQAQELIDDMSGLFAGGTLTPQDEDAVMRALQEIYWEAKERNIEKYTPKKHKKQKAEQE